MDIDQVLPGGLLVSAVAALRVGFGPGGPVALVPDPLVAQARAVVRVSG